MTDAPHVVPEQPDARPNATLGVTAQHASAPDPQVLRAIEDIRTLRTASMHERKARALAEADLHREVVETVRLLLSLLEHRWPERVVQCQAAARLAARLAHAAGLSPQDARSIQVATMLQDVGMVALPDALLRTSVIGMSAHYRALYHRHPVIAQEALGSGEFRVIGKWIRHHHERWDGHGYPDGLAGEDIPLPARIVALVTAYVSVIGDGGTAVSWRRDQLVSGAFDPSLLRLLQQVVRQPHG